MSNQPVLIPVSDRRKYTLPPEALIEDPLATDGATTPEDAAALVTMVRTYSSPKPDGTMETWEDICRRVVEGVWSIVKYHYEVVLGERMPQEWADKWATRMYRSMVRREWCPAGRGLQHMGHDRMWERGSALLNSCAFVSSADPEAGDPRDAEWVYFLADMSMLGVGVGFDTTAAGLEVPPSHVAEHLVWEVEDTREGWADLFRSVVKHVLHGYDLPAAIDFGGVRKKGTPLKTMGGIASGPGPLMKTVANILRVLGVTVKDHGEDDAELTLLKGGPAFTLTEEHILDIGNNVGVCVVSGGIRRNTEICLFRDVEGTPAFTAKADAEKLMAYRWASNNAVVLDGPKPLDFFERVVSSCSTFGDPGLFFRRNAQDTDREKGVGTNPCVTGGTLVPTSDGLRRVEDLVGRPFTNCGEQVLESYELCNLVETVPCRNTDNWRMAAVYAFMYGKFVSLLPIHYRRTNEVVKRNRRVGVGITGWRMTDPDRVTDALLEDTRKSVILTDELLSENLRIPTSVNHTTVKPSDTVSLVMGVSPGMNPHFASHYIRRINIENSSPLLPWLQVAGYKAAPNAYSPTSHVVEFPMKADSRTDFTAIEQLEEVLRLQTHWSNNMVSNTIVFDEEEIPGIAQWVYDHQDRIRSLSFLKRQHGFEQPVLEELSPEEYAARVAELSPLRLDDLYRIAGGSADIHDTDDKYCEGDKCSIAPPETAQEE